MVGEVCEKGQLKLINQLPNADDPPKAHRLDSQTLKLSNFPNCPN